MSMTLLTRFVMGGVVGAALGYGIYRYIGCSTGACPLNANPYVSVLLWSMIGALMVGGR